jgi:hypothetical protein
MALEKYTLVSYVGTDVGNIYLEDIGKRRQLGGGDQFIKGQDIVIRKGDTVALVNSGAVLTSAELGILKTWSTNDSAALVDAVASGSAKPVYYGVSGGTTGISAPLTLIPSAGSTGVVRAAVTGGKANPPKTIGDF